MKNPFTKRKRKPKIHLPPFRLHHRENETEQHYRKRFHRAYLVRRRIPVCLLQILVLALCFSLPLKFLLNVVVSGTDTVGDPTEIAAAIGTTTSVAEASADAAEPVAPPFFFFLQLLFLLGFEWFIHRLARKMRHRSHSEYRLFLCKLVAYGLFFVLTLGLYYLLGRANYLWVFSVTAVFNDYEAFLSAHTLWSSLILFHALTAALFLLEPLYAKLLHSLSK